ncbi:MAG: prolyl oligopeptidase family serine peptidase [Candidatus Moraniibacteriota bacterium]
MKRSLQTYPIRTRFAKEIVAEMMFPEKQTGKIIILCSGLPSSPVKNGTLRFLANQGYVAIYPRYRGTWESDGLFLKYSPYNDIRDIANEISKKKKVIDLESKKGISLQVKKIFVLGVSFGGPSALLASSLPIVSKVVAISPVVDWKIDSKTDPFISFVRSTQEQFGMAYRTEKKSDWDKLMQTDFYNPMEHIDSCNGKKIFILHAEDDEIVPIGPSKKFAEKVGGSYYWKRVGGHTLRIHHQFIWKKIETFLEAK